MKINKPSVLILAIVICQLAGILGSFFTTPAIPTWYVSLNKPTFSPPNWVFGPVWTILYTLMGIAVYKIWIKKDNKGRDFAVKIFAVHLFLNFLWSVIFFGAKNLGLAFFEISVLWVVIIYLIKLFAKIDKLAAILLVPYLLWVSFAAILNLSVWTLNPNVPNAYAQEFDYKKAYSDYAFTKDGYNDKLTDFNKKKDSYLKNPTLSLKEELRTSLYNFSQSRNDLITTYLTALRLRILESNGLTEDDKNKSTSKISEEFKWFGEHKNSFNVEDSVESLIAKSQEEDKRLTSNFTPAVNSALVYIGYGDVVDQEQKHKKIYEDLKTEANNLVSLGRADSSLFDRWFKDVEGEFENLQNIKSLVNGSMADLEKTETYAQERGFNNSIKNLEPAKESLLKINQYLYELENVISEKR